MKLTIEKKEKTFSKEHLQYIKLKRKEKLKTRFLQILVLVLFALTWEVLAYYKIIDSFIVSCPSRIMRTIISLYITGQFWNNFLITSIETLVGFALGTILGIIIASLIWYFPMTLKITEPYLVILNALPKVALGPIIIIWMGASTNSIILMAILISIIIAIINILNGFISVNKNQILLMKSFGATRLQIFSKLVFPSNIPIIISTLKINIGMSLIGVITGEFLVSETGIGYLIIYGSQVFKMDLVMTGIIILAILAWGMYTIISKIEKIYSKTK